MKVGILAHTFDSTTTEDSDWSDDCRDFCGLAEDLVDLSPHMQAAEPGVTEVDIPASHSWVHAGFPEALTVEIIVRVRLGTHEASEVVYR
jgi:hypothetical protein